MIKFELNEQMVRVIAEALGNAPYRIAQPVLDELQKQISAQQQQVKDGLAA